MAQRGCEGGLAAGENVVIENGKYKVFRNAIPTSGSWNIGDVIINTSPAATGNIGWVYTTVGTLGTWKSYGTISS